MKQLRAICYVSIEVLSPRQEDTEPRWPVQLTERQAEYAIEVDEDDIQKVLEDMQFNLECIGTVGKNLAQGGWYQAAELIKNKNVLADDELPAEDGAESSEGPTLVVAPPTETPN